MAQVTDRTVGANPTGFDMRTELNNIIAALESDNSGSSEPLNPVAYMKWLDTSNATYYYYKERNHDNTDWVTLFRYTVATKIMEAVSNEVVLSQTNIANEIHISTSKATPVDADEIGLIDSASTFTLKKLTWANLKARLKTYLDTLYVTLSGNQTIADVKTFTSSPIVSGIKVGNTAIADAITLDWYEEGTFTPVVVGSTTAGVGTYVTQEGIYTRVGNIVYINIHVKATAHTGTGNMLITGLPFVVSKRLPIPIITSGLTYSNSLIGYASSGASHIQLVTQSSGGGIVSVPMDTVFTGYISFVHNV